MEGPKSVSSRRAMKKGANGRQIHSGGPKGVDSTAREAGWTKMSTNDLGCGREGSNHE